MTSHTRPDPHPHPAPHAGHPADRHAGPHPGHGHGHDIDWEAMAVHLEREAELHTPALERAAAWVRDLPRDGHGPAGVTRILDVGSGPGVITCLLARAFPRAEVVAVDGEPALLRRAEARAAADGLDERVRVHHTNLPDGLAEVGVADLLWAGKTVHHFGDQQAALTRLAGTLRPGGVLAIVEGGLPPRFLPRDIGLGHPGLQARMDVAYEAVFADMRASLPGSVSTVEDWPAMFAHAGLAPAGTRSFLIDLPAPLDPRVREHLHATLSRNRERFADHLTPEDLRTLDALLDDGPAGIRTRPDAFYLTVVTVHTARALP